MIVALGVILLPSLLDGEKKHYQDEFAAIPLVPKLGEDDPTDAIPPPIPALNAFPQEAKAENRHQLESQQAQAPTVIIPSDQAVSSVKPSIRQEVAPLAPQKLLTDQEGETLPKAVQKSKNPSSAAPIAKSATESAPVGQAYIVQLGALRNAEKVNEIVAKLRLSGYNTYTEPSSVVQGEVTRIFVGPEVSREKLQTALPELNRLSALDGQIRRYSTH